MDPIAHSLFGAALARTRLGRDSEAQKLYGATLCGVVAANLPDVDALLYLGGAGDLGLLHRRGLTHGPLGLLVLGAISAFLLHRALAKKNRKHGVSVLGGQKLALLMAVGVVSHPLLDWLNTYGVRLLAPFEWRWFYGDTLFIADPWMWLLLGLATVLGGLRWLKDNRARQRAATALLALFLVYVLSMLAAARAAQSEVRATLEMRGVTVEDLMVGPLPVTPFRRNWVATTPSEILTGQFQWLGSPKVSETKARFDRLPQGVEPGAREVERALSDPCIRGFVNWMRFPTATLEQASGATRVRLFDVRYAREPDTRFGGAEVTVP